MENVAQSQTSVSTIYQAHPLFSGGKSIRILRVNARVEDDPLECDLQVANLDEADCPDFNALTYVWGAESTGKQFVTCGGQPIEISTNCYSALQHLRKKLSQFTIWVDAICINQRDEREKLLQIPLMGEIYSRAANVYVWLGEGDGVSNRAMRYLEAAGCPQYFCATNGSKVIELPKPRIWIALCALLTASLSLTRHPSPLTKQRPSWISRHIAPSSPYASYEDLNSILDRAWINRIWTFQEILLASNPVVVCGDYHLPWWRFEMSITFLHSSGLNYRKQSAILPVLEAWAGIISGRDELLADSKGPDPVDEDNSMAPQKDRSQANTRLQRYHKFIINVTWFARVLSDIGRISVFFSMVFIFGLAPAYATLALYATPRRLLPVDSISQDTLDKAFNALPTVVSSVQLCYESSIETCRDAIPAFNSALDDVKSLSTAFDFVKRVGVAPKVIIAISIVLGLAGLVGATYVAITYLRRNRPQLSPVLRPGNTKVDLVTGLCTRKSIDPKDKAFALHSILQKLSGTNVQVQDNTVPLREVYKELTIRLIQATKSLELLTKSGLRNFEGFPSWIPNWAEEFEGIWMKPQLHNSLPRDATPGSRSSWKWYTTDADVLAVRCRYLCTISNSYTFLPTLDHYDSQQKDCHLSNLKAMLNFWNIPGPWRYFDYYILRVRSEFGELHQIEKRHLFCWASFFSLNRNEDPQAILSDLVENGSRTFFGSPTWHPSLKIGWSLQTIFRRAKLQEILNTHIAICNCLSKTNRSVFTTSDLAWTASASGELVEPVTGLMSWFGFDQRWRANNELSRRDSMSLLNNSTSTMGMGSDAVRAGDSIILVAGVSYPLVIRRDRSLTRLISPANVWGVMSGWHWNKYWQQQDLEEVFLS